MDRYPITGRSLEWFFDIDGDLFERQYKRHLSGYWQWKDSAEGIHAEQWRVFPQNIGPHLSIDETSLSRGELYTIVTNKEAHGRKNAIVAIVLGTDADTVIHGPKPKTRCIWAQAKYLRKQTVTSHKQNYG